jgi:hypothetical protein
VSFVSESFETTSDLSPALKRCWWQNRAGNGVVQANDGYENGYRLIQTGQSLGNRSVKQTEGHIVGSSVKVEEQVFLCGQWIVAVPDSASHKRHPALADQLYQVLNGKYAFLEERRMSQYETSKLR